MQVLRFVSPAIVVQLALEDVAGSGAARHLAFDAQSDAFHERYRDHFFSKVEAGESMTAAGVEQVPRFTFVKEPVSQVAGRILFGALVLLLAALALIGLAWPRLKRVGRLTR
jgi:ABC-2 type transport system permease protein